MKDSHLTGRPEVGKASFRLADLPACGRISIWLPLGPSSPAYKAEGDVLLDLVYKVTGLCMCVCVCMGAWVHGCVFHPFEVNVDMRGDPSTSVPPLSHPCPPPCTTPPVHLTCTTPPRVSRCCPTSASPPATPLRPPLPPPALPPLTPCLTPEPSLPPPASPLNHPCPCPAPSPCPWPAV